MIVNEKVFFFVVFLVTMAIADTEVSRPRKCGVQNDFCGRGPNRTNCCENYECNASGARRPFCDLKVCGKQGAFCGRGPNRKDCCGDYICNIAPNDSHAFCVLKTTCGKEGIFCGNIPNRKDCCENYECIIPSGERSARCVLQKCGEQGDRCTLGTSGTPCCKNFKCIIVPRDERFGTCRAVRREEGFTS